MRTEGRGAKAEPDSETPRRRQVSRAGGGGRRREEGGGAGRTAGRGRPPARAAGPEGPQPRRPSAPKPGGPEAEGGSSAPAARRIPGAADLAPLPVSLL